MSDKSKKDKDKPQEKKGELVSLTNGMIDGFQRNPAIVKLRGAQGLRAELKYKVFKLIKMITDSTEAKTLHEMLEDMAKKHDQDHEKQKKEIEILEAKESRNDLEEKRLSKLREEVIPLQITDPTVQELFDIESGLSVEKLIIPIGQLPQDFTATDMFVTDWIIEYVEK